MTNLSYMTFNTEFKDIVLSSQKECTTRLITSEEFCYYSSFMYESHMFEIDSVERVNVHTACNDHHEEELFASANDMYNKLKEIYVHALHRVTEEQLQSSQCFVVKFHRVY